MSGAALTRKQYKKYEMWWFADKFGWDARIVERLSYAERQAYLAVETGVEEARRPPPGKPKQKVVRSRRPRRRPRRRR